MDSVIVQICDSSSGERQQQTLRLHFQFRAMLAPSFAKFARSFLSPANRSRRLLAIDYGTVKCGLALCDFERMAFHPLKAVRRNPHTVKGPLQSAFNGHFVF